MPRQIHEFKLTLGKFSENGSLRVRVMPYNVTTERYNWWTGESETIQFDTGSLEMGDLVPLTVDHSPYVNDRIGVLTNHEQLEDGLYADLVFANTEKAQDTRELLKLGAIEDVSAGVYLDEGREFKDDDDIVHKFGEVDHVAIVPHGQFGKAGAGSKVLAVHSAKGAVMPEPEVLEVEPTTVEYATAEQVDALRAMVAELAVPGAVQHRGHEYLELGDMLVDVIAHARKTAGHSEATERLTTRIDAGVVDASGRIVQFAFPGPPATSVGNGVAYDPYIPELLKLLRDGRPTANLFNSRNLPTEGNRVFMPATTVGNIVGYQDAQGDQLANQIQTQILTDVPKATIGGGQPVSIQAQLWTNPSYMGSVAEDLLEAYAEFVNSRSINGDPAVDTPASLTGYTGIMEIAGTTDIPVGGPVVDVIGKLGDAWAAVWNGTQRAPRYAIMSSSTWGAMINLVDADNRPLITISNPVNPVGSGDAASPAGTLRGLTVVVDDEVGDTDIVVTNFRDALLFENTRNPAQLQLTYPDVLVTDISVFGFSALFIRRPAAFAIMSGITP